MATATRSSKRKLEETKKIVETVELPPPQVAKRRGKQTNKVEVEAVSDISPTKTTKRLLDEIKNEKVATTTTTTTKSEPSSSKRKLEEKDTTENEGSTSVDTKRKRAAPKKATTKNAEATETSVQNAYKILVEHCVSWRIYPRNASTLVEALRVEFPDFEYSINVKKPRSKSFEVTLVKDSEEIPIWSGIQKGPPRNLKFPESEIIINEIKSKLQ